MFRWAAIPKFAYMECSKQRYIIVILTFAAAHVVGRLAYMYVLVNQEFLRLLNIPPAGLPKIDAFFFKNVIDIQLFFCFIIAFRMGAGLISRDLLHGATVLYMSKPINKWEYFLGKFATLFYPMMVLTWLAASALFIVQAVIAPENSEWHLYFMDRYFWMIVPITVYSAVICSMLTLMILAASSMTKNSRYAATALAVYTIGSSITAGIVAESMGDVKWLALSPVRAGYDLGSYLFLQTPDPVSVTKTGAWTGTVGLSILCFLIVRMRIARAARYGR